MRRALAAPAVAATLALAACGGGGETPANATSATSATVRVPGTSLTMTAPSTWEQQAKKGSFMLRAETASGTPQYLANVVVTTAPTKGRSLGDAGAAMSVQAHRIDGWKADEEGQGGSVLARTKAYRISGTYRAHGVRIAQQEQVIEITDADGTAPLFAYVTGSWAIGDEPAQRQVTAVIQSLTLPG